MKKVLIFWVLLIFVFGYFFFNNKDFKNKVGAMVVKSVLVFSGNNLYYEKVPKNILEKAAYRQIGVVTKYDFSQGYYAGGRPPEKNIGVCTDVVADALKSLGYNLQEKIFKDIKKRPKAYNDTPDKNINYRRAPNMAVYFAKYETSLPLDFGKNLETWKGGDVVVWKNHVAVVSSKKRKDGLPYAISNHGGGVVLADILDTWNGELIGHFRINLNDKK